MYITIVNIDPLYFESFIFVYTIEYIKSNNDNDNDNDNSKPKSTIILNIDEQKKKKKKKQLGMGIKAVMHTTSFGLVHGVITILNITISVLIF